MASTPSPHPSSLPSSPCSVASASGTSSRPISSGLAPEKHRRYDRQLRLWGDHGQHALENAHVLLVNATPCGTEVLKALVLPGCGSFTVLDNHRVEGADAGNNFFIEADTIGQSRGAVATRLLLELNHEVRGESVDESPDDLITARPDFFKTFTLVVAADLTEKAMRGLSKILWEANIPLMIVRAYGFIGYIRLQAREHTVIESHPDNEFEDLRLDVPFPALKAHMDAYEAAPFVTMDKADHGHIPYLVLLYKYLQIWKGSHDGNAPKNYKEKALFKELIMEGVRRNEDGVPDQEENFEEAIKAVNKSLHPTEIPRSVKAILEDKRAAEPKQGEKLSKSDFWVLTRAIKDFVENEGEGMLPVRGSVPDMFSYSARYIALQNCYRDKAAEDASTVGKYVQKHLDLVGRPPEYIRESAINKFCKEAYHLELVRTGCSIAQEMSGASPHRKRVAQLLEEEPDSALMYYFILRGVDRFYSEFNALPGVREEHVEPDIGRLKGCVAKILAEYGLSTGLGGKEDCVHEVCRVGGSELHSVASIVGGCAAQEVIKLITGQFVPINNLFIYNALTSDTMTLQV